MKTSTKFLVGAWILGAIIIGAALIAQSVKADITDWYTPEIVGVSENIHDITLSPAKVVVTGDMVQVSGMGTIDPDDMFKPASFNISLPIDAPLAHDYSLTGSYTSGTVVPAEIGSITSNMDENAAHVDMFVNEFLPHQFTYQLTYSLN